MDDGLVKKTTNSFLIRRVRRKNTKFCPYAAEIGRVRAKKTHFFPRMRPKKTSFFSRIRSKHDGRVCFLPSTSSFLRSFLPHSFILSRTRVFSAGLVRFLPHPAIKKQNFKCNLCVAVCDCPWTHRNEFRHFLSFSFC